VSGPGPALLDTSSVGILDDLSVNAHPGPAHPFLLAVESGNLQAVGKQTDLHPDAGNFGAKAGRAKQSACLRDFGPFEEQPLM